MLTKRNKSCTEKVMKNNTTAGLELKKILKDNKLSLVTKVNITDTMVFPIVKYGSVS